jgi:hypothetical protein
MQRLVYQARTPEALLARQSFPGTDNQSPAQITNNQSAVRLLGHSSLDALRTDFLQEDLMQ